MTNPTGSHLGKFARLFFVTPLLLLAVTLRAQTILVVNYANGTANAGSVGQYAISGGTTNATLISGLTSPTGIAVDASGRIYVAFQAGANANTVAQYSSAGTLLNANFITGLGAPQGLAFDASGNLYVGNTATGTVGKYSPTGSPLNTSFITGQSVPIGLAFNASGDFFVVNATPPGTGERVARFDSAGNLINSSFVATGLSGPQFLAFDGAGGLFVSNGTVIGKFNATTGATINSAYITGLNNPEGIVIVGGNLFVAENNNRIGQYTTAGTTGSAINASVISGLSAPYGVAVAIPEPSAYVALLGALTLGFACWRRKSAPVGSRTIL